MKATIKSYQDATGNSVDFLEVEIEKLHVNYSDFDQYLEDNRIEVEYVGENEIDYIIAVYPDSTNGLFDIMNMFNTMFD